MPTVETSPARKKRQAAKRRREEREWAERQPTGKPFEPEHQADTTARPYGRA